MNSDQIISNFLLNREDHREYNHVMDTLFYSFVKSDEFVELSKQSRIDIVNQVSEIKGLIGNIIENRVMVFRTPTVEKETA